MTLDGASVTLSSTAKIDARGGTLDGCGGDVEIDATGDIMMAADIDVTGTEGGTVCVTAGVNFTAGNLTITADSTVDTDSAGGGGCGGSIDLTANGDGATTGNLVVDGTFSANASTSSEFGGGLGGCITVTAAGSIDSGAAASFSVEGGTPDGSGGEVEFSTDQGPVAVHGSVDISNPGADSSGGALTMNDIGGAVTITGTVDGVAGDQGGGEVDVEPTAGGITITNTATIDVSSNTGGTGGTICLNGGSNGAGSAEVVVSGTVKAEGGGGGGKGGTIEITGTDSVRVDTPVSVRGGGGGGGGGAISIMVDPGPAVVNGALMANGNGTGSPGGVVAIDAESQVMLGAAIDARGQGGTGGMIGVSANGPMVLAGDLRASTSGSGAGGHVEILANGNVAIGGMVVTDATAAAGRTDVAGCEVTVCGFNAPACPSGSKGVLSSQGPGGINHIVGRDQTAVFGDMLANSATGRNEIVYNGNPLREPVVLGNATPRVVPVVDLTLIPCLCGNGHIDDPEECDDGNVNDGDGCSSGCVVEVLGDANADMTVNDADVAALIREIFDGDGDSVLNVRGGAFPGGGGADANRDGRITAADITAIVRLAR